jgi:mannose/cellobiose epimerase-like protein (N-acyl-D-glucosamine 2-epimerase family)
MLFRKLSYLGYAITIFASFVCAQTELVKNGSFSSGTTNWNLGQYGGSSSGSVTGGEYRIIVATAGSENWHVQFTQSALQLVMGKTYVFSFDAYKGSQNSGTQSMQINVGQSSSPYASYFGSQNQMVTLTTSKIHYTFTFAMTSTSDNNARVEFNCGKSTGSFYFDNVSLQEISVNQPRLSVSPLSLNFGVIDVGSSRTLDIVLQNGGNATTTISAIQSSTSMVSTSLSAPATVSAGNSITLPVIFTPLTQGGVSGTISIYSDASDNPILTINCTGEAVLPGLILNPVSLALSSLQGVSATGTITLSNSSSASINWNITASAGWMTLTPSSGIIAANSYVTLTITASNTSAGVFNGGVQLTHSAVNISSPVNIPVTFSVQAEYQPTCPYIKNPQLAIDFVRNLVAFRMKQRDNVNGGFYSHIDRQGNSTGVNEKSFCGQSRIAYAFVRAFMLTGDEQYLEQAHHALKFLYDHGWNNGWYLVSDAQGNHISHWGHDDWWSFQQHYALIGISSMVEATGGKINWNDGSESDHTWLMRGINLNYTKLWDSNSSTKGYFDRANTAWTTKWNKGFHATVDGITTHALLMSMMYDSLNHKNRFIELADNAVDHLIAGMNSAAAGFPEVYNSNWNIDNSVTSMDIGHGFKTAWVLQRAYLLHPDHPQYLTSAQALMQDLWEHGCYDSINGAPYRYLNWQTGVVTSKEKDFWMVEQGFTSGIMSYYTARSPDLRDRYMRIADGSLNFFMDHLIDPVYGESYNIVSENGMTVVDGNKGGLFTAGYHSTELGYYTYLYSSLYYHGQPVDLYYYYPVDQNDRSIKLTPLAIEDDKLKILAVTLDGQPYTDFNSNTRRLHLPAGIGGKLKVTFGFTPAVTHSVTAIAGTGGTITPSGVTTVNEGTSITFSVSPLSGYRISDVGVDGVSAGAVSVYTISSIVTDHTITAAFSPLPVYTITAGAGAGGSITPSGVTTVFENGTCSYTITPDAGYRIESVLIDGVPAGAVSTYEFTNIVNNHTINVTFTAVPTYTIAASSSAGGTITPAGSVTVSEGASKTFSITPLNGYEISGVSVDGQAISSVSTYTFNNVTENHTINAMFALKTYTITANATAGGSISPSGVLSVSHGATQAFTITSEAGYRLSSLVIDGVAVTPSATYTFTSVNASHTIAATFTVISSVIYQINCGSSSSVTPYSADRFSSGGTQRTVSNSITLSGLTDPAPQAVYQSERYGSCTYTIPELVPSANYVVRLHFAELYWTATGKRVFDVTINGVAALSNFDIYSSAGARYKAIIREFTTTSNSSGQISIVLTTKTDNATLEGIEILETIPNNPPEIVTPVSATPAVISGNTTTLSVLGSDDNGESNLSYSWSATGTVPSPVSFSVNNSNSAKNCVATFAKAGSYTLQVTLKDQGNKTVTSQVTVTVNQTPNSISITPVSATVNINATQLFSATVVDQFGVSISPQPAVVWSVNGGGTIGSDGRFTAGNNAGGPYTISAVCNGINATATVSVSSLPAAIYQVDCGSSSSSTPFSGDQFVTGGTYRSVSNSISTTGITDPAPQSVYRSERYGNSTYTFPSLTPSTTYKVRLHFAELYWNANGKRKFNVQINGTTVLSNYDIFADAGAQYKAVVREITAVANSTGNIVVSFTTVTDNASIEGIEILR